MTQPFVRSIVAVAIALSALGGPAAANPTGSPGDETQPSEAGLRAVAEHWNAAERDGDVAFLEQLLVPEYRSIDAKGEAHPRAVILAYVKAKGGSAERRREVEAYKTAHPTQTAVTVHGTLGVVAYFNPTRGIDHSVRGSDVFVYEDHHWHAVYSLHNSVD
jgi:hypothetical protein